MTVGSFLLKLYDEAGVYGSETGLEWIVTVFRDLLRLQRKLFIVSKHTHYLEFSQAGKVEGRETELTQAQQ